MNERAAADAYCKLLAAEHYENFIVASPLLRSRVRLDLIRLYAYCRTTDDLGDESGAGARVRLERWRDEVTAFFAGRPAVHPVLIALQETVATYALPERPFVDLIAANIADQSVHSYETWPELFEYCSLSAAPVGRLVLQIFGLTSPAARSLSDDVCIGLQLANHAQDVTRDAALGRTYLLQTDIRAGGTAGAVRALCERGRAMLQSGRALEAMAPQPLRFQLALYRLGGLAICERIEALGYRTDLRRPSISPLHRSGILMQAVLQSLHPSKEQAGAQAVGSHR